MSRTIRKPLMSRQSRFRAALALARMTIGEWVEANGVTRSHVYQVLRGDRKSASLVEKIDAFIDKHLGDRAA